MRASGHAEGAFRINVAMMLFMFYAVAVWYGAVRWRRSWLGFIWVSLGCLGVLALIQFHKLLNLWTSYDIYLPVLQTLLWGYISLVASVGYFIASIPKAIQPWCCRKCRYDLTGVPGFSDVCPECGTAFSPETAYAAERRAKSIAEAPRPQRQARKPRDMAEVLGHTSLSHGHSAANQPPQAAQHQDA